MKAYTINGKDRAICTVFPFIYNSTCSSNTLYKSLLLLNLAHMELNHFKLKFNTTKYIYNNFTTKKAWSDSTKCINLRLQQPY